MKTRSVSIGDFTIGGGAPLVLMAGPCVLESRDLAFETAERTRKICATLGIPFVFKSSFDKANRSSIGAYRGPGLEAGLAMLGEIKERLALPIVVDVHRADQIEAAGEVADILQVPAFLCRQTDFLLAVARSGKVVNVKKGQFLSPWDMARVVEKVESTGNRQILLTERGVSFGYQNLVVDMRALPVMRQTGCPVVYDATHSVQLPGGEGDRTGGQREFIPFLARAAVAAGVDGLFMEVHPDPEQGLCDATNMYPLDELEALLKQLKAIHELCNAFVAPKS